MTITKETVLKTAKLARLKIEDEGVQRYANEISNLLNLIDVLNEVNTDGVEPMVNVNESAISMHKDEVSDGNCADEILKNAPKSKFNYFLVPKVIE